MADTETTTDPSDAESEATKQHTEYVTNSSKRESVLRRLVDGPAPADEVAAKQSVPSGTSRQTEPSLSVAHTKSAVEQLRDRGLVELLETDRVRAYSLTASGERVMYAIEQENEN